MARGFRALVGRLQSGVAGALNFRANVRAAARQTVVASLRAALQRPATRVTMSPADLRAALQRPATRVTQVISGAVSVSQRAATRVTLAPATLIAARQRPASRQSMGPATLVGARQRSGGNIVHIKFDLTHQSFIATAANRATNTQNWTNPANAQGPPNASAATWGNPLSILSTGTLNGTLFGQSNRPASLAITAVYLQFYSKASGLPIVDDLLSGASLGLFVNTSPVPGPDKVLARHGINYDNFAAGEEFRIDDGAGKFIDGATPALSTAVTWANIALLVPYFKGDAIVGVNPTVSADACRLRVVASETQAN